MVVPTKTLKPMVFGIPGVCFYYSVILSFNLIVRQRYSVPKVTGKKT